MHIDLQILKNPCIPGINSIRGWCMIFLTYCCIVCYYFIEDFCLFPWLCWVLVLANGIFDVSCGIFCCGTGTLGVAFGLSCSMACRIWGFPGGSDGKESACDVGDLGSIPGLGISPGGGHGHPRQCSCLEKSMDRGAWQAAVHKVSRVRPLRD